MTSDITAMFWNTDPLYSAPNAPELESDLNRGAAEAKGFREDYLGKVASLDAAGLQEALRRYEALTEILVTPQLYAHLLFAADAENDEHKKLSQRTAEFGNLMGRELLFFDLEVMEIPDGHFAEITAGERLAGYRHYLESVRKFKPHTLTEREEQLLKLKNLTGAEAFSRLFDELSASFRYRMELEGEEQEFTGEELLGLLHHPDAAVRERAFATFLKRHEKEGIALGAIFNTVALDHGQELELRSYRHPMEPTNLGNEIPEEVVNRLMDVSEANYGLARDYFRLKARLLGLPKLKNTDVYAPVGETDRRYTFEEAREMVLEAYGAFQPRFRDICAAFFAERRIDVLPRPGKGGGAFCMGMTPSLSPYVLLNFTGNLRDVATLAHELGHGLHFVLAQKQTMLNYHAPLPLAETASVFGEMLLTRSLLARESDPQVKIALLCAKIEDIIATTFRQNVLTRFEERMHKERKEGLLTSTRLCDLWWEENGKLYGDAVEMIDPTDWGGVTSPTSSTPVLLFSYTFAELCPLPLPKYLEDGAGSSHLNQYPGGGSSLSSATRAAGGIDLADPTWQKGYDFLAELIEELKGLVADR